jgi:serine/threonine protein kinase
MGLDYLHRVCQVIHTDLKPENVSLCLTEEEVREIASKGQLTTTKMFDLPDQLKKISAGKIETEGEQRGRCA